MSQTFVVHMAREALFMVLLLAGPSMAVALLIGLLISVLQATTQIQDQMLNMVPKIVGMFLTLLLLGSWMLKNVINYTTNLYGQIPNLLH
ncbi:flagellar biosynthesis protein FliQ [Pelotomaculum terephthalicicum JT]|uniref:flagellar biosynthesis protein FliQ n=1 Tax=Pelotomaculum TaxID=191373 RepID=UPI0009CBEC02|nr:MULTISPECIES: flagellar biosynthesis protein FliQ [Pelotomaculum]MCG9967969.1 flagellar biosynthesis protein FliQ [Pelotomaculum terephthalicicum JT]OPX88569.1 MAG: Flagellar biosynthetic protein FliQ [Pelotomaculum sp. PtaB.Bin117]OPY63058.1 MAG: Flagellar biosynthetic protein FliQ [Pelotomaculum sp. PtaU1.Bin065]